MKNLILLWILFSAPVLCYSANQEIQPSVKSEQSALAASEGINFGEWESEFDASMKKAKVRVKKCESGKTQSQNCQFEKFQALDPSVDVVH